MGPVAPDLQLDATAENHFIPKYYQVERWMRSQIASGEWKPGLEIPSERELCTLHDVSRGTLRRAVDNLVRSGLLTRVQGRSTSVSIPDIPIFSKGFRALISESGQTPHTAINSVRMVPADARIASILQHRQGDIVLEISRTVSADDDPIILETVWIAGEYAVNLTRDDIGDASLLQLIPQRSGVILKKAVEYYEPIVLSELEAEQLHTTAGDVAIGNPAVTYDVQDIPVFYSQAVIRKDRARMVTQVTFQI
jgi:GntR family transcriptional regulator